MISGFPTTWSTPGPQPWHSHGSRHLEVKVWRQRCALSFLGGWFGIHFTVGSIVVWLEIFLLLPCLHHGTATSCPWGYWCCASAYSCRSLFLTWPWTGPVPNLPWCWGFPKAQGVLVWVREREGGLVHGGAITVSPSLLFCLLIVGASHCFLFFPYGSEMQLCFSLEWWGLAVSEVSQHCCTLCCQDLGAFHQLGSIWGVSGRSCLTLQPREETFCNELVRKMVRKLKYPWRTSCLIPPNCTGLRQEGASFLVDFSAQTRAPACREVLHYCDMGDLFLKSVLGISHRLWSHINSPKVICGFGVFFPVGGKMKIKAEIMSPCQHLLWSAQVHDFDSTDGYGMWQPLISSEWLHALGKHSFLLKAIRKERRKRGRELQTPFTYLGD